MGRKRPQLGRRRVMLVFKPVAARNEDTLLKGTNTITSRAKVPGGWLVTFVGGAAANVSICFMPDAGHSWDGSSLPDSAE
jgi:hypothetical protein